MVLCIYLFVFLSTCLVICLFVYLPVHLHLSILSLLISTLEDFDRHDHEKRERKQAENNLDSHILETQDALYLNTASTMSEWESFS